MPAGAGRRETWTVMRVLGWTSERFARERFEAPRLEAEVLLAHSLQLPRVRLYTDFDKPLQPQELAAFRSIVRRRLDGEPAAYIVGEREFWSLPFRVGPGVLIPRPETEHVVEHGVRLGRQLGVVRTTVDVGTGSGAIAVALARELPGARVLATDIDERALEAARANASRNLVELELFRGDLLHAVPADVRLGLVVSNPPYIPRGQLDDLQPEVSRWEPRVALDGGDDGMELIRRLATQARERLVPGGYLVTEIGWDQGPQVADLLDGLGYDEVAVHRDLAGLQRVVTAASAGADR